ncbi:MAG: hypothetical protein QME40_02820 [bacterium]|nr:hypothetical protein [bacterium]
MDKQNKTPKGIKIIAGLMFVIGLINFGMHLIEGITWTTDYIFGEIRTGYTPLSSFSRQAVNAGVAKGEKIFNNNK